MRERRTGIGLPDMDRGRGEKRPVPGQKGDADSCLVCEGGTNQAAHSTSTKDVVV